MVPAAELMVVVPAALQFQVGDVAKFAAHCVASTLTEGGSTAPPLNSQALPALPSQSSVPAGQFTQAPPVQVCVFAVHATVELQVPLDEHVCTPLPEHWCVPGTHTPVHAPLTHADDTHAVLLPHAPLDEHVSTL